MARARNIKPSIMDNDELAELEPLTRLLFIYLWMLADREGRLEDRPRRIAGKALPYDRHADVDAMLNDLQRGGFIQRYTAHGIPCIQILAFAKHQTPHVREAVSELPEPVQGTTLAVPGHNLGNDEASPRSPDSGFSDSGYLIPDTGLGTERGHEPEPEPEPDPDPAPEPTDKPSKARAPAQPAIDRPDDVDAQTWGDWLALRRAKKAPVSGTVLAGARAEAAKAGLSLEQFLVVWCTRGSQGLQADWLRPEERGRLAPNRGRTTGPPSEPAWRAEQRARVQQLAPGVAARPMHQPQQPDFIDVEAKDGNAPRLA